MNDIKLEWYVLNSVSYKSEQEKFDGYPYIFHDTNVRPWNVFNNWVFKEVAIELAKNYLKSDENNNYMKNWDWCDDFPTDGTLYEKFKFNLMHELAHEERSRCEYEICVAEWPPVYVNKNGERISVYAGKEHEPIDDVKMDKIDCYSQVLPNADIFCKYVLDSVKNS